MPETALHQYWTASKCRLERWKWTLYEFRRRQAEQSAAPQKASSKADGFEQLGPSASIPPTSHKPGATSLFLAALEEILLSEVFSRVWTALLEAHDQRRSCSEAGPIARSVLLDHFEVRRRLLNLLLQVDTERSTEQRHLNQLRTLAERWTDLLLGALADLVQPTEFAFDPARVRDFAGDFSLQSPPHVRQQAWKLTLASLRSAFAVGLQPVSANPDLNQTIAQAVVECLPRDIPLLSLPNESLWCLELDRRTGDLENLLSALLADQLPS